MKKNNVLTPWLSRLVIAMASVALLSCSNSPDYDYLDAQSTPPTVVPEGSTESLGELYRVPQELKRQEERFDIPLPPAIAVQANANIASVQLVKDGVWVLNSKSPATTWSQLINFWSAFEIPLAEQDLSEAVMETVWFDEGTQPGFLTRYQMHLERGFQSNTTEIHLLNDRRPRDQAVANAEWPSASIDLVHANLTANRLVSVLNDKRASAGDSYLASTINLPEKIQSTERNGEPVLSATVETQRLQLALTKALSDRGFQIYEQASSLGIFHIDQYEVKKKRPSWLRFLTFKPSSKDNGKKRGPLTLDKILMHLPDDPSVNDLFSDVLPPRSERKLANVPGYLLVVKPGVDGSGHLVYIRDGYGKPLKSKQAESILNLIHQRLI